MFARYCSVAWNMYRNIWCLKQCNLYTKRRTKDSSTEMLVDKVNLHDPPLPEPGRRLKVMEGMLAACSLCLPSLIFVLSSD